MNQGFHLLAVSADPKTRKGELHGYLTGIVYLAPEKLSGMGNVCPHASKGCASACLNTAGRGAMGKIQDARIRKTRLFFEDRLMFLRLLHYDLNLLKARADLERMIPCARINGTSDIPWEKFGVMDEHPLLQFYDYTKNFSRMMAMLRNKEFFGINIPPNYHLTFSRSENNDFQCMEVLRFGGNVAVVFGNKELPVEWNGYPVIRGDETDLRFLDGENVVVGLTAKGKGKRDTSGFVVRL